MADFGPGAAGSVACSAPNGVRPYVVKRGCLKLTTSISLFFTSEGNPHSSLAVLLVHEADFQGQAVMSTRASFITRHALQKHAIVNWCLMADAWILGCSRWQVRFPSPIPLRQGAGRCRLWGNHVCHGIIQNFPITVCVLTDTGTQFGNVLSLEEFVTSWRCVIQKLNSDRKRLSGGNIVRGKVTGLQVRGFRFVPASPLAVRVTADRETVW